MGMKVRKTLLHSLDASEVSFVKKGAIDRKFLVLKSAHPVLKASKWEEDKHKRADDGKFGSGGGSSSGGGSGDKKPAATSAKPAASGGGKTNENDAPHMDRTKNLKSPTARSSEEHSEFHRGEALRHGGLMGNANRSRGSMASTSGRFHGNMKNYHTQMAMHHENENENEHDKAAYNHKIAQEALSEANKTLSVPGTKLPTDQNSRSEKNKAVAMHFESLRNQKKPEAGGTETPRRVLPTSAAAANGTGVEHMVERPKVSSEERAELEARFKDAKTSHEQLLQREGTDSPGYDKSMENVLGLQRKLSALNDAAKKPAASGGGDRISEALQEKMKIKAQRAKDRESAASSKHDDLKGLNEQDLHKELASVISRHFDSNQSPETTERLKAIASEFKGREQKNKKPSTEKSAMAKSSVKKSFEEKVRGMIAKINPEVMKSVDDHLDQWQAARAGGDQAQAPMERPVEKDMVEPEAIPAEGEGNGMAPTGPLSEEAVAAIKAVVRILSGFKDELDPGLMHEVLEVIGYNVGAQEGDMEADLGGDLGDTSGDLDDTEASIQSDLDADAGTENTLEPSFEGATADQTATDEVPGVVSGSDEAASDEVAGDEAAGEEAAVNATETEDEDLEINKDADGDEGSTNEGDEIAGVSPEHLEEATEAANKAFKEHLQKLGYSEVTEDEGTQTAEKPNMKGETVTKSARTTVDLSQVDPQVRAKVEQVFKSNAELVKKTAELEGAIKARDLKDRNRELVAKAASWKHLGLPQDEMVAQLKDADKVGKDAFERVCKSFDTLNAQASEANLFGEIGSSQQSHPAGTPDQVWEKITKAAEGLVQKSAGTMSSEQALDKFLQTNDGQRLYREYKAMKGGI